MNRRRLLIAGGGAIGALVGGTAVASATRADILADDELTRGKGGSVEVENTITRESVEYLESTDEVRENGQTQSFKKWARGESAEIGAAEVLSVVEDRLDKKLEGVGSGVRYLVFGPVIAVHHYVTRNEDGSIISEPNVTLDQLISAVPQTMTVTVVVDGHTFTKEFPVGVGDSDVYQG